MLNKIRIVEKRYPPIYFHKTYRMRNSQKVTYHEEFKIRKESSSGNLFKMHYNLNCTKIA